MPVSRTPVGTALVRLMVTLLSCAPACASDGPAAGQDLLVQAEAGQPAADSRSDRPGTPAEAGLPGDARGESTPADARPDQPAPAPDTGQPADLAADSSPPADTGTIVYPTTPGVYVTITAGPMAGTYQFTKTVDCYFSGFVTMTGTTSGGWVDVHTTTQPATGQTLSSPEMWVALAPPVFGQGDDGYYPVQNNIGSCSLTADVGWPKVRARFSCTGLKGISTNTPFEVKDGMVVCP